MLNVYEQVNRNIFRSSLVISGFVGFVLITVYLLIRLFELNPTLIIPAIIFSLFSSLASYFWGDKIILTLNRARPADRREFFDFYTTSENLARAAAIPTPRLYVIDSPAPNAFATGRDPAHALICATTGLLTKLNRTELEAVIAHEISHIKNYDIRLMMVVALLIGSLSLLINMSYYHRGHDNDRRGSGPLAILGFFLIILSPFIARLMHLAISRRREYLADASAVKITRQPEGLINALIKISQDSNILEQASPNTAPLYIANPFKDSRLSTLFSTHPPVSDRVQALRSML